MTELIGRLIKDNDPRMPNRILQIRRVENGFVFASKRRDQTTGLTRIRMDRLHTDDKPRRSGWSVITEIEQPGDEA